MVADISIHSIKEHLEALFSENRGIASKVCVETGIKKATLSKWLKRDNTALPNIYNLLLMSKTLSLSLNELAGIETEDDALNIPDIKAVAEVLAELPPAERKNMRKIAELYPDLTEQQRKTLLMMVEAFSPVSEEILDESSVPIDELREHIHSYSLEDVLSCDEYDGLAAGYPKEMGEPIGRYAVSKRLIEGNIDNYAVSKVHGTSMTEVGIADGCKVLMRAMEDRAPISGKIYAVRHEGEITLKCLEQRLNERYQPEWFLVWRDGSGKEIAIRDENWAIMAEFVAIVRD